MSIACLLAPHLPVQVERSRAPALDGRPLVVGGRPWDPGAVLDCCALAAAAGVRPGMFLLRAEALCPTAAFVPADEGAYHAAHGALENALRGLTDRVETAGLGFFLADVRGPAHRLVREAQQASGLADVRLGLAGDRFSAEQAARAARPGERCAVPPGQEPAFLSPLPLSALPADDEFLRRLHLLGVRTLGALAALPRLALVRQFGPPAGLLHDLASGRDPRPLRPDAPPLMVERSHTFEPPLADRQRLTAQVERLLSALAGDLARRGYQAEGLRLRLDDEEGTPHATGAPVEPPSADPQRLIRRAGALLDELDPPCAVVGLTVTLYPLRPACLGATQLALLEGPTDARRARLQETLRRLRERLGELAVTLAALIGPPPPRPLQVTSDPDGVPCALAWPERILPVARVYEHWRERRRWWTRPLLRDYYRLETADGQVRVVFRDRESGRWWLERRTL